jgi:hypothetical protein
VHTIVETPSFVEDAKGSTDLILAARLNPKKALCGVENPRCSGTTAAVFA